MQTEARKIEGVNLEWVRPDEDVTPEVRDEHQADIDSDECQCRDIERCFSRIRRCLERGGSQDKLKEYKSAQKPTQNFEARHARARRNLQVKILRAQASDAGWRVQAQNAEQARDYRCARRHRLTSYAVSSKLT